MGHHHHSDGPQRPAHSPPHPSLLVLDRLGMFVTGDPIAEIDSALAQAAAGLRTARDRGDESSASALAGWIDERLEQRSDFDYHLTR